ncbi:hypothetical protein BKG81_16035 [Mycobacteroides chelonae]|nr:hypothetical protein BKG81_16035 [Mycobacteroides chelonae]
MNWDTPREGAVLAMSRVEAAKALGISPTQLDTEKREGRIAPRYLGRKPLYPIRELQAWLDALPSEPPTAY